MLFAPFGYALRAGRDSPLRAEAIGIDVKRMQWAAFVVAGAVRRAGRRAVRVLQGQHLARQLGVGRSVDGLVMVLLGGVQTLAGPVVGAVAFTWLQDAVARNTDYWRALLGAIILLLVLVFPQGIAGFVRAAATNGAARASQGEPDGAAEGHQSRQVVRRHPRGRRCRASRSRPASCSR